MYYRIIRFIAKKFLSDDWIFVRMRMQSELEKLSREPEYAPSLYAQQLLVSGEDHRHARHYGFDPHSMCRAAWRLIIGQSREGASTIEQQIVRVITGRYERTLARKLREILLASLIAETYPKSIIPSVYLQIGYYGWQMNGYRSACQKLQYNPKNMLVYEAAELVARLKYPEPQAVPSKRYSQIKLRRYHLMNLREKHLLDGTYKYDYNDSFRKKFTVKSFVGSASKSNRIPSDC